MGMVDEYGFTQRMVMADHLVQATTQKIDHLRSGLHRKDHRRRGCLMEEMCVMFHRFLLTFNMVE